MIVTLKVLSALLCYPTEPLQEAAPGLADALAKEGLLSAGEIAALQPLLDGLAHEEIYALEERYVALFDRSRYLSLYLFEHLYGESRDRGQMMVKLVDRYRAHGLCIAISELPDYLPLYLEYLAQLPQKQALTELAEPVAVLAVLADRLTRKESPYAAVLSILKRLADRDPDPEELENLAREPDSDPNDFQALDKQWIEDPVVFGATLEQQRINQSVTTTPAAASNGERT